MKLFVEMKQLAAGILQEELTDQNEGPCKHIHKQREHIDEDGRGVGMEENGLVGNEEFEFAH